MFKKFLELAIHYEVSAFHVYSLFSTPQSPTPPLLNHLPRRGRLFTFVKTGMRTSLKNPIMPRMRKVGKKISRKDKAFAKSEATRWPGFEKGHKEVRNLAILYASIWLNSSGAFIWIYFTQHQHTRFNIHFNHLVWVNAFDFHLVLAICIVINFILFCMVIFFPAIGPT